MTLYLKYRPQTIGDLDLASARESLKSILSKDNIPHAFLFAGPKGTGKTSAARIMAKALNCEAIHAEDRELKAKDKDLPTLGLKHLATIEPCNECPTCISITRGENLDVMEIDAASHRGIDDIRTLREAVKLAPAGARKKVYIIDEAHMLTTEACNALLKVLEEPPSHVIFILATTNPEKLIDTIRSRTTIVHFTKATEGDLVRRLQKIAAGEKVEVEDEVLSLIAKGADGAFRDGVKLFEQILSEEVMLTKESISEFLFGKKSFDPEVFIEKLEERQVAEALDLIEHGIQNGVSAKTMARGILDILRAKLLYELTNAKCQMPNRRGILQLLEIFSKAYSEIPNAYLEQLPLEIATVRYCNQVHKIEMKKEKDKKKDEPAPVKNSKFEDSEQEVADAAKSEMQMGGRKKVTEEVDTIVNNTHVFSDELWIRVLQEVRPKNASTEALLRASKPLTFDGERLHIGVFYKFHKERLESHPHRDLLEEVLEQILGNPVRILCTLTDPPTRKVEEVTNAHEVVLTETQNDGTIIKVAKEIFGS